MKPRECRSLPLLASGPVALAVAAGRQSQHRQPFRWPKWIAERDRWIHADALRKDPSHRIGDFRDGRVVRSWGAPWRVGDSLYVRECHRQIVYSGRDLDTDKPIHEATVEYRAGGSCVFRLDRRVDKGRGLTANGVLRWTPNILMPEDFARTRTTPLTRVWAERVQDISEEDARAEGCPGGHDSIPGYQFSATPREHFRHLWESFYPGSWERNDWLWCCAWDGVEVRT